MWRLDRRKKILVWLLGGGLFFFLFLLPAGCRLLFEFWWFDSVGYRSVFRTLFRLRVQLFCFFSLLGLTFLPTQLLIALFLTPKKPYQIEKNIYEMVSRWEDALFLARVLSIVSFLLCYFLGLDAASRWGEALLFLHRESFGVKDPLFKKDIGFYIFQYPFYSYLLGVFLLIVVAGFLLSLVYYIQINEVRFTGRKLLIFSPARWHLGFQLAALLFLVGIFFFFSRYGFLFQMSRSGNFPGPGFTDVHFTIPSLVVLSWLFFFSALVVLFVCWGRFYIILGMTFVFLFFSALFLRFLIPSFVQRFVVEPDELAKEKPYIQNGILATRAAYQMDAFEERTFFLGDKLEPTVREQFKPTLDNIRLWDYRPFLSAAQQLQGIWPYYTFLDVDYDHYWIDGKPVQVAIAVRELDHTRIPEQALNSWINRHFTYTHGVGFVMASVAEYRKEGQPHFLVKDIPPEGIFSPARHQVYFGEIAEGGRRIYVFVKGKEKELDYPSGDKQIYTQYQGKGGIPLDSLWKKLVLSFLFQDFKILISSVITKETKVLVFRNIRERASRIAPYLYLDSDPYPVVTRNRIYWIFDAYTGSPYYPLSASIELGRGRVNTLTHSVKVVVDAYDGTVFFYQFQKDPILEAYKKAFPRLIKPIRMMPQDVREHLRYPLDFFTLQAELYRLYHTTDPKIFFSRQDVWAIPEEVVEGDRQPMEPYYVMLQGKPEEPPVFSLMLPFTPEGKENMTAWMAGFIDKKTLQPKTVVYRFPKEKLTYGPMQIEARIDTDEEISKLFTLWRQKGSQVIRGNLLVIPLSSSLLYVEPIYLQAEESKIPELKKIIMASEERVVIGDTIEEALQGLLGRKKGPLKEPFLKREEEDLTSLLLEADQALARGDLEAFGKLWKKIRANLRK